MPRSRSPNYPAVNLERAITDVRTLYDKVRRVPVALEAAVQAWGYKGLSGIARTRLAALNQYGLIEYVGNKAKVTDRGLTFSIRAPESSEWLRAAKEAALEPDIFRELYETYAETADEALRFHLIKDRNFTDEGASKLIASFRSTLAFAKLGNEGYDEPDEQEEQQEEEREDANRRRKRREQDSEVQTYSWPLSGSLQAEVILSGRKPTADDLDMLRDYLDVAKRALMRSEDIAQANEAASHAAASGSKQVRE